ncbi:hypothetical protein AAFF_G00161320 [Aldrovandia affinis]|uniref:Uncharacterized protein n=1 Tax=Aldrovandia affinis TaxID=143900 RepID=A0AAD7W861_9TELE|nr:hypothetical protein AAFF_G00161320 [Aldrovandia affinis]
MFCCKTGAARDGCRSNQVGSATLRSTLLRRYRSHRHPPDKISVQPCEGRSRLSNGQCYHPAGASSGQFPDLQLRQVPGRPVIERFSQLFPVAQLFSDPYHDDWFEEFVRRRIEVFSRAGHEALCRAAAHIFGGSISPVQYGFQGSSPSCAALRSRFFAIFTADSALPFASGVSERKSHARTPIQGEARELRG